MFKKKSKIQGGSFIYRIKSDIPNDYNSQKYKHRKILKEAV